ncbi:unnamed protein product [Closterium sp. Yama58-4]|nr:unnamed protein product [Closterium sp. Yama58-4]
MAAEGVTSAVNESMNVAVLAAVREELAAHKEEVDELQHMLTAVKGELAAVKVEFTAIKGELVVVKGELAVVKGELAKHEHAMAEKVAESSRALDGTGLKGKSRKRKQGITGDFAQEEERRREVQELNRPHAMEDLAASKEGPKKRNLKLNVALQIKQSRGDQKMAWKQIKAASRRAELSLKCHDGVSDAMLGHVSTMTRLKGIDLESSSGFSAEGIKHLYRLPQLETLNLMSTHVPDSAFEGIGSLTSLKGLYLFETNVTDAGLLHLTGLSSLKVLWLSGCKGVTNDGMVHVGRLIGLTHLWLNGTAVTDDGLQQLTALTKLTDLHTSKGFV